MANQKISISDGANTLYPKTYMQVRRIDIPYSMTANGQFNTNLYTLINADLPSGWTYLGIAGFSTNEKMVYVVGCYYADSSWSFQIANASATAYNNKTAYVYYLATPLV